MSFWTKILSAVAAVVAGGYLFTRFTYTPKRVSRGLAVGNSILAHGGALQQVSAWTGAPWDNVAVVGSNTASMVPRARDALSRQRYSHVLVMGGPNDGAREPGYTINNLSQIYRMAKAAGADVIAVTELPWQGYASWSPTAQTRQDGLNTWLKYTKGGGLVDKVIDAHDVFLDRSRAGSFIRQDLVSPDQLHPNATGQRVLGQLINRAFRRG